LATAATSAAGSLATAATSGAASVAGVS
jgi:hypothetical protein